MAYFLAPFGNSQVFDANGAPLVGGSWRTFLAGTTTARTTYTSQDGSTPQGTTMTLNALGLPENGAVWMQGGIALKFRLFDASGTLVDEWDNISGIGDTVTSVDQWEPSGLSPTYISATSFSLTDDQTTEFQVNRQLKTTNTGGTVYSRIFTSTFSAGVTTVVVTNSSGVLDSGLSAVAYGFLSADNQSIPPVDQIVNAQTGTTYTYAKSDKGKLVTHTNAAAIAGTLPVASTTGKSFWMDVQNRGVGTLTITPTTSTIDGAATLALTTGQGVRIVSDGTNYFTMRGITTIADASVTAPKLDGAQTGSAPIFGVRAWVNFNGTGTVAIRASGNVSSITDNGTGDYTVNFTTAMPNANYAVGLGGTQQNASNSDFALQIKGAATTGASTKTTSALRLISSVGAAYSPTDSAEINVIIVG